MLTIRFEGLDKLRSNLKQAPKVLISEVEKAINRAMLKVQSEAQSRTPVKTGLLKSSIGGAQGYFVTQGWRGEMGTNLKYAFWVEVRHRAKHDTGEWGYMQKGIQASMPFIRDEIEKVAGKVALTITK